MIWILNRPARTRQLLALGIALVLSGAIVLLFAFGASIVVQKYNRIDEQRTLLGQLNYIIDQMPNAQQMQAIQNETGSTVDFLRGPSETVIRANLQQRFKQMASEQKVNVISVGNAPDFTKGGIAYVGLQANVSGTIEGLHHTFLALESAQPLLFLTKLTVRSTGGISDQAPTSNPVLIAQLRLYGALQPQETAPDKVTR